MFKIMENLENLISSRLILCWDVDFFGAQKGSQRKNIRMKHEIDNDYTQKQFYMERHKFIDVEII